MRKELHTFSISHITCIYSRYNNMFLICFPIHLVAPTVPPPINTVVFNASSIYVNEYAGSVQICATIISGAVSTATTVNAQVLQGTAKTRKL